MTLEMVFPMSLADPITNKGICFVVFTTIFPLTSSFFQKNLKSSEMTKYSPYMYSDISRL